MPIRWQQPLAGNPLRCDGPNLMFQSLEAVENRLVQAVLYLENHRHLVVSITGFDWIANIPLNAT